MPGHKLKDLLKTATKKTLTKIAKENNVVWKGKSADKAKAIDEIAECLLDVRRLFMFSILMDETDWGFFANMAEHPCQEEKEGKPVPQIFLSVGYLYGIKQEEKPYIVMPEEIQQMLATEWVDLGLAEESRNSRELFSCAMATVNLYGAMRLSEFTELYNKMFGRSLTEEVVDYTLTLYSSMDVGNFLLRENYLVDYSFAENDFADVFTLLQITREKPRYLPEKAAFLRYADQQYFESNPATEAMLQYLQGPAGLKEDTANELLKEIQMLCYQEASPGQLQEVITMLEARGVAPLQEEQVADLLADMINNTRFWHNKGYTPLEMSELAAE